MIRSYEEFVGCLDADTDPQIREMLSPYIQRTLETQSLVDLILLQERQRVLTIKRRISNTHKWSSAVSVSGDNFHQSIFWCERCNMKASAFDYISSMLDITRVTDKHPSYTVHNNYLSVTCEEACELIGKSPDNLCSDCGLPSRYMQFKCS